MLGTGTLACREAWQWLTAWFGATDTVTSVLPDTSCRIEVAHLRRHLPLKTGKALWSP